MNWIEKIYRQFKTDNTLENIMWTTPAATEMRFGFEVTMYVMNVELHSELTHLSI